MSDETVVTDTETDPEARGGRVARAAIAIIFGLFFAYVLLQGISTLVNLPPQLDLAGIPVPWLVLIALVVISPLVYVAAVILTATPPGIRPGADLRGGSRHDLRAVAERVHAGRLDVVGKLTSPGAEPRQLVE